MSERATAKLDMLTSAALGQGQKALRTCVVSENMSACPDEGIKKFTVSLITSLSRQCPVLGISVGSSIDAPHITGAEANKLFFSQRLRNEIRAFAPDLICYVPTPSDTVFSFMRLRVLSFFWPKAITALIALQPRPHSRAGRWLLRRLAPDLVFVQSRKRATNMQAEGIPVNWLPSGVDVDRFRPVNQETKQALRAKYGLPQNDFLVLHVGHITRNRNLAVLAEVQRQRQVVMVTGNSVGQDEGVRRLLRESGVIVFDQYLDAVEEIYQAADCFLFPVSSEQGSIEIPLSVLEAMACNLPVVSTRFGGLEDLFAPLMDCEEKGLLLADDKQPLIEMVSYSKAMPKAKTRDLVQPYSWDAMAARLLHESAQVR